MGIFNFNQSVSIGKGTRVIQGGKSVVIKGCNNVTIDDSGKVFIDGVPAEEYEQSTGREVVINVYVTGDVKSIENCDEVHITGSAEKVKSHNGNIHVGGDVSGDVSSHNGNISCGNIGGDVDTHNGNISYRK